MNFNPEKLTAVDIEFLLDALGQDVTLSPYLLSLREAVAMRGPLGDEGNVDLPPMGIDAAHALAMRLQSVLERALIRQHHGAALWSARVLLRVSQQASALSAGTNEASCS